MNWRDYWNGDSPVYVSERHKLLHARTVASDEAELIAELARAMGLAGKPVVLDHGCGEQLALDRVRKETSRLYLIDGAETVRTRLAARVGGAPDVVVLSPEAVSYTHLNQSVRAALHAARQPCAMAKVRHPGVSLRSPLRRLRDFPGPPPPPPAN